MAPSCGTIWLRAALIAGWLLLSPAFAQSNSIESARRTLTKAAQIRGLTAEEGKLGHDVRLSAVVTYSDGDSGLLFVQDETGGVYINASEPLTLPSGTLVEVIGLAQAGTHLPFVARGVLFDRGITNLPPARPVTFERLATGLEDSNWIETEGVVRSVQVSPGQVRLSLSASGRRILARIGEVSEWTRDVSELVDAEVRLRGVAGAPSLGPPDGILLDIHVPHPRYFQVRKRGLSALTAPLRSIAWLREQFPTQGLVHRIRMRGQLENKPGSPVQLRDDSGTIDLATASLPFASTTNSTVEVAGFPAGNPAQPRLEDITVSLLRRAQASDAPVDGSPAAHPSDEFLPVLTEVSQVRKLSSREAARGYPVRIRGVITFSHLGEDGGYLFFVQDATAGIYVHDPDPDPTACQAGRVVDLEGVSDPGQFAPIIRKERLTVVGEGPMPPARPTTIDELLTGRKDSQRVRLQGIITRVNTDPKTVRMGLLAGSVIVDVSVPADTAPDNPGRLVDAEVRISGVCGTSFNAKRQLVGLSLFMRRAGDLTVVKPAPADPFDAPPRTIRSLFQFDPGQETRHRVRVAGVVTLHVPGVGVYLQDEMDGLFVPAPQVDPLELGSQVEVIGFPQPGRPDASLLETRFRSTGPGIEPSPQPIVAEQLASGDLDNRLIVLDATLLERRGGSNETVLVCRTGPWVFDVLSPSASDRESLPSIGAGSLLRLTGVWAVQRDPLPTISAARLLLRSPRDLMVLARPGWWTPRHTFAVGGGLLAVILLALAWVFLLRRQVAERTEQTQRLHAQLLQAQKMESVGRLAGGVAHDFNNMLQTILGNAALALEENRGSGPLREHLDEIQKAARRSADLTRQLLAFARKQTIHPRVLDLNDTVSGMLKMLRRLMGEDIQLAWIPGPGLWPVRVDPSQIDQVLANLAVNARDAIQGVGRIVIETSNVSLTAAAARAIPESVPGDYVQLTVRDTGAGMPPEVMAHLFEPFFTTKAVGKGTGLGLATVYGIVKQNGGAIRVESAPGQGTAFMLYFPRVEAPPTMPPEAKAKQTFRGTETVLLVEDEEMVLNLAHRILKQHGYTVLAARVPEDALQLASRHAAPIDLLVTDVIMPGMNGRELRDRLATIKPGLRCLFMSGYTADAIAHQGVLEEGVQFMQKPFSIDDITRKVREVLDQAPAKPLACLRHGC